MQPSASHFQTPLDVAYPRPTVLSDPFHDFFADTTRAILAKPDAEFGWSEFKNILGPFLPAGTYDESVYFLPPAFEYIVSHDDEALDLVTSIVWFVSEYSDRLAADGLLHGARERIGECFRIWTRRFKVMHYHESACRAKQWGINYLDLVEQSEVVCEGMCDLVRFGRHADLADGFFRQLAEHGSDPMKAAWFLEMSRARNDVRHPPKRESISLLLSDENLIRSAVSIVKSSLTATERSPTYWRDTIWEVAFE
jgi:hypothetical protein